MSLAPSYPVAGGNFYRQLKNAQKHRPIATIFHIDSSQSVFLRIIKRYVYLESHRINQHITKPFPLLIIKNLFVSRIQFHIDFDALDISISRYFYRFLSRLTL